MWRDRAAEWARGPEASAAMALAAVAIVVDFLAPASGGSASPLAVTLALQVAAAACAWRLLLRLGAGALAAFAGAGAYALVGLQTHPVSGACLPLLLLGIEWARDPAKRWGEGAAVIAIAVGLPLVIGSVGDAACGFVVAGCWILLRLTLAPGGWDGRLAAQVLAGVACGALIAVSGLWLGMTGTVPGGETANPWTAAGALVLALLAGVPARRQRAIRWMLVLWVVLCAGRAAHVALASFLQDIVAPMPDAVFLDRAIPSMTLAAAVLAALAWNEYPRLRIVIAAAASVAAAVVLVLPPVLGPAEIADDLVSDGPAGHDVSLSLAPGESLSGEIPSATVWDGTVRHVGIEIGTFMGKANGALRITLCAGARCESGAAPLDGAADNAVLFVTLDHALAARAGSALHWRATHVGGEGPVAVWLSHESGGRALGGPAAPIPDAAAHIILGYAREVRALPRSAP